MHCPSGLKVSPESTTRPTTGFETPANSSLRMSCGSTDSDELVPKTVKTSSLMYFIARRVATNRDLLGLKCETPAIAEMPVSLGFPIPKRPIGGRAWAPPRDQQRKSYL